MEKPVTIQDLMDFKFFGNLKTDEDSVLFVQGSVDEKEDRYAYDLMQYQPGSGSIRQLTNRKNVSSYIFKNPQQICFLQPSDVEKETLLMEMRLDGGEALESAVIPAENVSLIQWIDEKKLLLLVSESIQQEQNPQDPKNQPHKDYEIIDEVPWYFNGQGFINKKRSHLYLFDLQTRKLNQLAKGFSADQAFEHDQHVYFAGNPDNAADWTKNGLYSINLKDSSVETLVKPGVYGIAAIRQAGKDLLVFASDGSRYGLNENPRLYAWEKSSHALKQAANWDETLGNTIGTDCAVVSGNTVCVYKDTLYFTSTIVEHNTVFKYEDGAVHQVFAWQGTIHSFGFANDALYFIGAAPNELQQLWKTDLSCLHPAAECLSDFNSQILDHYIAKAQPVFYTSHSGQEQMGWVLYPIHFDLDQSYPGILDIHGGPKTVYGTVFYHEMQVWASEGYFVFFCNPFGSDGQGNSYSYMRDRYGTVDYEDLMAFTDAVLEQIPQIDPKRLGVTGGSYGGFMTNWILGHTGRFSAAATQRSISNWISFYGTSDIGPSFVKDQQGYGLENIDKLWDHSPLKYVRNVTTPTLVIHSDEDYRCPLEQGMQMFTGIQEQHVPARMIVFHGENHDLSRTGRPSHRVRRLQEITDWMKTYAPSTEKQTETAL